MDLATEETYAVVEPSGDTVVGLDGLDVEGDMLYAVKGRLNIVSVYGLRTDAAGVVTATFKEDISSPVFDNPSTIDVVGNMLYNANTRSQSLPFPATGETDPSTFNETFSISAVELEVVKADFVIDIGPIRPEGIVMLPPGAGEAIGLGPGTFALVSET